MATDELIILATDPLLPATLAEISALRPPVRVVAPAEVERDPSLLPRVEVVHGGVPDDYWAQATGLKWVQVQIAGVDRDLTPEAKRHPAVMTNVHIHGAPMTEHFFGLLLALTRGLHAAYRHQLKRQWTHDDMRQRTETLAGRVLGIVGLGAVGKHTAEVARAFDMRVWGVRRRGGDAPHVERIFEPAGLREMLPGCDYVLAALPLTADTTNLIGAAEFAAMKPGAFFFNLGRGRTVDTPALVDALRSGRLRGAGLDVMEPEPLPDDHPLWTMPNVIVTSHYAGFHPEYFENANRVFVENLRRYLAGEQLLNIVDKAAEY